MRRLVFLGGLCAVAVAAVAAPADARAAAARSWSPFVLVAGLLLIGGVAHEEGLFDRIGSLAARHRGRSTVLLVELIAVVALVTVVLNLDTAVAFLTPILVLTARRRGLREAPFLYASFFMANAASLLLPGSNLTNLLVLAREQVSGAVFAARMFPAWFAAVVVTTVTLLVIFRHDLRDGGARDDSHAGTGGIAGAIAAMVAGALVLFVHDAALPVVAVGVATFVLRVAQQRLTWRDMAEAVDLAVLPGLFGLAVGLGTLATSWSAPSDLLHSATAVETAVIGALGAIGLNNLPAAVLFSSRPPLHPRALLIGLDLGPNLAVTGSLSALLWYRAAKTVDAAPSLRRVTTIGLVVVPLSLVAALGATALFAPSHL